MRFRSWAGVWSALKLPERFLDRFFLRPFNFPLIGPRGFLARFPSDPGVAVFRALRLLFLMPINNVPSNPMRANTIHGSPSSAARRATADQRLRCELP